MLVWMVQLRIFSKLCLEARVGSRSNPTRRLTASTALLTTPDFLTWHVRDVHADDVVLLLTSCSCDVSMTLLMPFSDVTVAHQTNFCRLHFMKVNSYFLSRVNLNPCEVQCIVLGCAYSFELILPCLLEILDHL